MVLTTYYSAALPSSPFFWIVVLAGTALTVVAAEQLCVRREMREGLRTVAPEVEEVEMGNRGVQFATRLRPRCMFKIYCLAHGRYLYVYPASSFLDDVSRISAARCVVGRATPFSSEVHLLVRLVLSLAVALPLIWRFDGDFGRKNGFEVLSRSGDSAFRDS